MTEAPAADEPTRRAPLRWQSARITRIERRTANVVSFFVAPEHPFAFIAGQHVDIRLTAPDGYQAQRSYSIASEPETPGMLELTIERLDDGEVSPFFHDVAAVGDDIELRGPIGGHFVWSVADGGPVVFIAGGSGVVPLMCMLRHRARQASNVPTLLLFSARTWDNVIFRDELLELHALKSGFELVLALTRDTAHRSGDYSRRIDAPMARDVLASLPGATTQAYICGSNPFVEAAAQGLIAAAVPASLIRTERYGG